MNTLLSEIDQLQKRINAHRPLSPHELEQARNYYKIGLTYTSNALEGNSLTESETKVIIEDGLTIGGKPLRDHFEALGHSAAYDFMHTLTTQKGFSQSNIKKMHKFFYERIDAQQAGTYRTEKIFISGSQYPCPSPQDVPKFMTQFIEQYGHHRPDLHPVVHAAQAHKEFVFIHPFIDGNGRVARLLMNLILLQYGYCLAIISPALRSSYIHALEKAHIDDTPFNQLMASCVIETQKDYLRLLGAT